MGTPNKRYDGWMMVLTSFKNSSYGSRLADLADAISRLLPGWTNDPASQSLLLLLTSRHFRQQLCVSCITDFVIYTYTQYRCQRTDPMAMPSSLLSAVSGKMYWQRSGSAIRIDLWLMTRLLYYYSKMDFKKYKNNHGLLFVCTGAADWQDA